MSGWTGLIWLRMRVHCRVFVNRVSIFQVHVKKKAQELNELNRFLKRSLLLGDGQLIRLLLPLALPPTVGFGLSNNVLPFFPICHQFSPSSHSQHLKIFFFFLFPSFPGSSPSSCPFQFLSEDLFGHPTLLHSL